EGRADLVEIVHRDRRRVEPHVGNLLERVTAGADLVDREEVVEGSPEGTPVTEAARQQVRAPGPPLVDEDDVTVLAGLRGEPLAGARHRAGGAQAGAAHEDEERIGDRLWTKCRED